MLATIYECRNCGDVWQNIERVPIIDTDNDEVFDVLLCLKCGSEVTEKVNENGIPCWHALTEEEIKDEMIFYEPE